MHDGNSFIFYYTCFQLYILLHPLKWLDSIILLSLSHPSTFLAIQYSMGHLQNRIAALESLPNDRFGKRRHFSETEFDDLNLKIPSRLILLCRWSFVLHFRPICLKGRGKYVQECDCLARLYYKSMIGKLWPDSSSFYIRTRNLHYRTDGIRYSSKKW